MDLHVIASSSKGNCCAVTSGGNTLLLDCGVPWGAIKAALGYETRRVVGCLVTHEHSDHAKALRDVMGAGIDSYMTAGTAAAKGAAGHRLRVVKAENAYQTEHFSVFPFKVRHDAEEPVGFLVGCKETGARLLYAVDTCGIEQAFSGLHYILVECNHCDDIAEARASSGEITAAHYRRLVINHMSLRSLKRYLSVCDLSLARQIVLMHLSDNNSDENQMLHEIGELTRVPTVAATAGLRMGLRLCPF